MLHQKVKIQRIHDRELISRTMAHPRVYPHISDDGCPPRQDFAAHLDDSLIYLGAFDGGEYLGLFLAHPQNLVCYEVHTCLLPSAWGESALLASTACRDWLFSNTPCVRIITNVPDGNDLALSFAKRSGMSEFGRNPKSIQVNGILLDQVLLGISKEEA